MVTVNNLVSGKVVWWNHAVRTDKFLQFVAKKVWKKPALLLVHEAMMIIITLITKNNSNNIF
jgi:hypothetical protein